MKITTCLEKLRIPPEFTNKTAFLFEVTDSSFAEFGIEPGNIALVDNSQEFSNKFPVAFVIEEKIHVGTLRRIAEDLYCLVNIEGEEESLLFSLPEIKLIGQVRGVYRLNKEQTSLIFEKL